MASAVTEQANVELPPSETLADLLNRLGNISPERVLLHPPPGTATEKDLEVPAEGQSRLVELVDGTLVEKPMGYFESRLAVVLIRLLESFVEEHQLGLVLGEAATLRYQAGLVRLPDVSYFSWNRFPDRELPAGPFLNLAPDLAIEVLSPSNTRREMERKRQECFAQGTSRVWEIDPRARTISVYTTPDQFRVFDETESVDGEELLPGFRLSVGELFARAGTQRAE